MVRISVVVALLAVGGATSAKDDTTAVMQTAVGRSILDVSGARSNTTLYATPAPLENFDIETGTWVPIIRFHKTYTPTAGAAGNFQDDPSEGLAKLSDVDINAITWPNSDGHSVFKLACEECTEPKVMYVKTKQPFVDTARGFGWGKLYDICQEPNIEDCGWLWTLTVNPSWRGYGQFDTVAAENKNDCTRWSADGHRVGECHLTACDTSKADGGVSEFKYGETMPGRCFSNGAYQTRTCEYPGKVEANKPCGFRKSITMSKWGIAPATPAPTPAPPTPAPAPPTPRLRSAHPVSGKLFLTVSDASALNSEAGKTALEATIAKGYGVEPSQVHVTSVKSVSSRQLELAGKTAGAVTVGYVISATDASQVAAIEAAAANVATTMSTSLSTDLVAAGVTGLSVAVTGVTAEAGVQGDPHVVNVGGQRFDITNVGTYNFIQVPRRSGSTGQGMESLLTVDGRIQRTGRSSNCKHTWLRWLKMSGKSLDQTYEFNVSENKTTSTPFSMMAGNVATEFFSEFARSAPKANVEIDPAPKNEWYKRKADKIVASIRIPAAKAMLSVDFVQKSNGLEHHLDFSTTNLKAIADSTDAIGGLLGVDDHSEATNRDHCNEGEPIFALYSGDEDLSTQSLLSASMM